MFASVFIWQSYNGSLQPAIRAAVCLVRAGVDGSRGRWAQVLPISDAARRNGWRKTASFKFEIFDPAVGRLMRCEEVRQFEQKKR